jgi:hypothetical protein
MRAFSFATMALLLRPDYGKLKSARSLFAL